MSGFFKASKSQKNELIEEARKIRDEQYEFTTGLMTHNQATNQIKIERKDQEGYPVTITFLEEGCITWTCLGKKALEKFIDNLPKTAEKIAATLKENPPEPGDRIITNDFSINPNGF